MLQPNIGQGLKLLPHSVLRMPNGLQITIYNNLAPIHANVYVSKGRAEGFNFS